VFPTCLLLCYLRSELKPLFSRTLDLPQGSLEWVLIGYIQFIMRSVLNLKRRTREICKTRHSLIFTGNNNKISRGERKRGCIAKMRICHGEIRQINILTIERKAIDSVKSLIRLDNLSEYQIHSLSNLLRVEVTNNDCFISRPTGSENSAV
jgi:hypothetical protein